MCEEWAKEFYLKGLRAQQHAEERRRNLFAEQQEKGQIITLNFDQDTENIIEKMNEVYETIKKTKYSWMDKDAIACFEFYSELAPPNQPKNPHIHIATKRMLDKKGKLIKATTIAQVLRRKFSDTNKEKYGVYGVNGEERTWNIARNYVDGSCISKSEGGEKWEYTKQDIPYRTLHNINHPLKLTQN